MGWAPQILHLQLVYMLSFSLTCALLPSLLLLARTFHVASLQVNNDLNGHFRVGVAMWGTPDEAGSWELLKSKKCWQPGVTLAAGYAFTCIARGYPKQEASLQRVIYPAMARKKISKCVWAVCNCSCSW